MKRWTYKVGTFTGVISSDNMKEELNRYGGYGWELISVQDIGGCYRFIFKMPEDICDECGEENCKEHNNGSR